MKLPYREGTWFAVPLKEGGFAVGVVARTPRNGKVLLGFFFGPQRAGIPTMREIQSLKPSKAIQVIRFGDLHLIRKRWPIIGDHPEWKRSEWPTPQFLRQNEMSPTAWLVTYSDDDPSCVLSEDVVDVKSVKGLGKDTMFGAGAVEAVLSKLLQQKSLSE
jgi:hypothetical protein